MILILIFAEALTLYGLIVDIILSSSCWPISRWLEGLIYGTWVICHYIQSVSFSVNIEGSRACSTFIILYYYSVKTNLASACSCVVVFIWNNRQQAPNVMNNKQVDLASALSLSLMGCWWCHIAIVDYDCMDENCYLHLVHLISCSSSCLFTSIFLI